MMKNFVPEFKKFMNRGNVIDLSVGVIIGSAFTAIVNGLSNNILKPLINFIIAKLLGGNSVSDIHTYLTKVYDSEGNLDLTQSIYIDWGALISAVINFVIIAFVLFCIVKVINKIREEHREFAEMIAKNTLSRKERHELRAAGANIRDKEAIEAWRAQKRQIAEEAAKKAAFEAAEKARIEREQNPTTEDLLKMILAEIKRLG
ncbi:MAG: large conductance mechanosensitive channel protein MscL [Lachnospiraceae bacterium]|nr:large conductance mechanosensitive channel protein MscL [Lachnospiraceae bacterium]